jgi:gamma-glutamyltranspeptidase/glutathione hydrolase
VSRHARILVVTVVAAASAMLGACKRGTTDPVRAADAAAAPVGSAATAVPEPEATGPDDVSDVKPSAGTDVAVGRKGAVTSAEAQATEVGRAILAQGGNAVDAAVAVGFALGVTHPSAGNIGGGGFMVVRLPDGKSTSFDFRETAPAAATQDMYLDADGKVTMDGRIGPRAAGIPGNVAGFALAHQTHGKLPWDDLLAPAIALARDGHTLDRFHADDLVAGAKAATELLASLEANPKSDPELRAAVRATIAVFQRADGKAYQAGDVWKQPELAATLEAIAAEGADAFYRGPIAQRLADGVKAMGGIWTAADLAGYRALTRTPIEFDYRGHRIVTMPPPSAGGVTLRQIFAASEALELYALPWESIERIHLYIEALRRVYADRNLLIADPDFVEIPMAQLIDPAYMKTRVAGIDPTKATPSAEIGAGVELKESPQTTHYSVVDGGGMAVATTFTLNGGFGAKVQVPGTGVTLNNEMDDFTSKVGAPNMFGLVQGKQNAIAPGKRMVSSMTPTIVSKDGKLRLVCGSPGGPTITTTVAQVLLQVIDHGRPLDQAIASTRIHHQWLPDKVTHEEDLAPATIAALEKLGHVLTKRGRIGHANCIEADPASGMLRAVADTGRDGGDAAAN